jgi:hypothetical protein
VGGAQNSGQIERSLDYEVGVFYARVELPLLEDANNNMFLWPLDNGRKWLLE